MMTREQLFLDSNLSIHELARACEIPSRKISQSINALYKKNFSEWVNEYRIHKAIPLLQNISENNYTIEGIGYDCGFNSRSAMYLAFKKIKGKSPGDYKA
jgi:AraC-like DNA-binding protein